MTRTKSNIGIGRRGRSGPGSHDPYTTGHGHSTSYDPVKIPLKLTYPNHTSLDDSEPEYNLDEDPYEDPYEEVDQGINGESNEDAAPESDHHSYQPEDTVTEHNIIVRYLLEFVNEYPVRRPNDGQENRLTKHRSSLYAYATLLSPLS